MSPALTVRDLTVRFGASTVVDKVSFTVAAGQQVAIIGESGSGKSLTLLALLGLTPPGAVVTGSARLGQMELIGAGEKALARVRGRDIGMVFQEPATALNPTMRIGHQLLTATRRHRAGPRAAWREQAIALARLVSLPQPEHIIDRYPHELSGGQRQRVVIAMALSLRPSLLLADEPTTALDATVAGRILNLLTGQARAGATAVVLVTHDMAVAATVADHLIVMRNGRIVEQGAVNQVLTAATDDYTRELIAAARATSWQESA